MRVCGNTRSYLVLNIGEWVDRSGITIPFTADSGYIALAYKLYRNWFTAEVDEVTIVPYLPLWLLRSREESLPCRARILDEIFSDCEMIVEGNNDSGGYIITGSRTVTE